MAVALQPFAHVYTVSADVKGKHLTSRWQDTLDTITVRGKQVYRRVQISTQSNGVVRTWISVFDPATLAPVSDTFNSSDGEIFARVFAAGSVTDYSSSGAQKGVLASQTVQLPANYTDFNSGQFGLALLQLPLAPHYSTTLTTFGPTDAQVQYVPIEVLRAETLHYGACSLDTSVVRATFLAKYYPGEGQNYMTFWLAKRPPYVAKLLLESPKTGLTVTFDLERPKVPNCPT